MMPHLPGDLRLLHVPDHRITNASSDIRIQTIHDLGPLEDAEYSEPKFKRTFKKRFNEILNHQHLDQVITVSSFTKSRLLHFFPHLNERVRVIPLAANHLPLMAPQSRIAPWPYLLFTGTLEMRKNVLGLLCAFDELGLKYPELRLMLIGKTGYGGEKILQAVANHRFKERIIWRNFVPTQTLMAAYKHAEALVAPSFYEGFGLPIIEAMRFRCPVICSHIPSFTEIGGDAIQTFDPQSPEEMATAIDSVLMDPKKRFLLKNLGAAQSQKFTWQETARKTWDSYLDLLRARLRENLPDNRWDLSPSIRAYPRISV